MKTAMPIEWHKNNLFNQKANIAQEFKRWKELGERIQRLETDADFLAFQITSAENEGREKFDADRYKRKIKI